ncbi:hypothetical protein L1887_59428 [Cichorium endivia]|nr:hypothetical protein L1887_59428 [Cichorium endivia]
MRNGGERKRSLLKRLCTRNRTNADPEEWVWAFEKMNMQREPIRRKKKHEIGGGRISDSELLDSMDGGRALQLKHEINVEVNNNPEGHHQAGSRPAPCI